MPRLAPNPTLADLWFWRGCRQQRMTARLALLPTLQPGFVRCRNAAARSIVNESQPSLLESAMGKYFLGWMLGVPAVVLLLLYVFLR